MGPELFRPSTVIDTLHHCEGTVLSLAKTAAMVEAHGGCIQAQSEGRGQGATFVLELPLHRPESGIETHDGSAQAEAA